MREHASGSSVNISSLSGKVGMVGQTNDSSAKAGLVGLTKAAAKELAFRGVRVNAVQPGPIRTEMTAALREDIWKAKVAEVLRR
jgi:3-oxoacyl-[acyl-carrier protein] reductase